MSNVNNVTISGNLCADPEVIETKGGTPLTKLRIAVNRTRKVDDEYVEEASFFNVTVFGNFAALCARKLTKGTACTIQGRLEEQRWETDGGEKRSKVVIIAYEIDSAAFYVKDGEQPAAAETQGTTDAYIPF